MSAFLDDDRKQAETCRQEQYKQIKAGLKQFCSCVLLINNMLWSLLLTSSVPFVTYNPGVETFSKILIAAF